MGEPVHASWSSTGLAVLRRACDYHGGAEAWRVLRKIRLYPESLRGIVPWSKGSGSTFHLPNVIEVMPHQRLTSFLDYPKPGLVGTFQDGAVRIQSQEGKLLDSSANHRRTFQGLSKLRRWSPLDALYFFGYALWHYHVVPFTLGSARLVRVATLGSEEGACALLDVEFSTDIPTHCQRQRFYVAEDGSLTRHDYCAEIIGNFARGAHYWRRYERINGFPIALERRVMARLGSMASPLTVLHATFRGAEVELAFAGVA